MAKRDLIIGGFSGYNFNQLKPWVKSICEVSDESIDKVVVAANVSDETVIQLLEHGFQVIKFDLDARIPIHVLRFLHIHKFLKERGDNYRFVVTTDVKDVVFQRNPFEFMEKLLDRKGCRLVAGSESMYYKDEPWGNENLMQTYGPYVHDLYKDKEIYNVGVLGGYSDYMKDLIFHIFTNGINRPIPIVDQAVFNVLIQSYPYKDCTYLAKQYNGWACHAGTTADPTKIEKFVPLLTEQVPIFDNGVVKTCDGAEFYIVHQYDRVPEWKEHVMKKYGQDDAAEVFTYKV
jgi:hypothetical protein